MKRLDMRRILLTRRSVIKGAIGGTFASILPLAGTSAQAQPATGTASTRSSSAATAIARSEAATRSLAIQGTGSIAIVTDGSSTFGGYFAEILSAEGVRDFSVSNLSQLASVIQSGPRAILLAPATPGAPEIADLEDFIAAGGGLVAMRPAAGLDALLGIASQGGTLDEGYVRITDAQVGGGLYTNTMQFHGSSGRYTLNGATQVAELYATRSNSAGLPAVTMFQNGAGRAAMYSYDLAHSVVLTRQGDPAQADVDTDGDGIVRSIDIYNGWVDLERAHVPQADIQQRLLVRLLDAVAGYPTPRLWYFPGTAPSALVATGDAHGNPESYFQVMVDAFSQRGMGMTFYVPTTNPPAPAVEQWINQGFDFGVHPYVDGGYGSGYSANVTDFVTVYGFNPQTARTHQVRWIGWSTAADLEAQFGIAMDFNSYQWGSWLNIPSGSVRGYVSGSGLPMRFAASNGSILSIYQQHTNLVDEQLAPEVGVAGLSLGQALAISEQTIDECIDQFHTAITTQYHVDYFGFGGVNAWVLGTTDYALGRGAVPLTAAQWLEFVKSRAATSISGLSWAGGTLSFSVAAGSSSQTLLLPLNYLGAALTGVTRDESAAGYSVMTVDGRSMAAIPASSGAYVASYEADTSAPVISNIVSLPASDSAIVTWTTDEPATSVVDYGLDAGLGSQATSAGMVVDHSVTLQNLTPATTYYYQVTSVDASTNSSSGPLQTFLSTPADAPSLIGINPASAQAGTAQPVTISGANFVEGATARLGATALLNVVVTNEATIQAIVPAALPVGQHDLIVTNPDGQSATLPDAYIALAPPPVLESVAPPVVSAGAQITLTGSGFVNGASVLVGTEPATQVAVQSSTSATADVPVSLSTGAYDVTLTNPDGQSDTLAGALTVSELPTVGHTTVADFTPGTFDDTAVASGGAAGDGAVVLASLGWLDGFDQPGLNPANWSSGLWDPAGSISISAGILSIDAAWVRSKLAIAAGAATARLTFTPDAWLNYGLSRSDDLDNPWFLFGVPGWDTSQVYVRYNYNGGLGNVPLPGLLGAPHDYTVAIGPGQVRFLVDGQQVHQVAIPPVGALATWLSSGSTGSIFSVDSVEIVTYEAAGSFLSPALDAGQAAGWRQLLVSAETPAGTAFVARARTSPNGISWSAWSQDLSAFPVDLTLPDGRYLQYELDLSGTDGMTTPIVGSVSSSYQAVTGQGVGSVVVSPTSVSLDPGDIQQFTAQVFDVNGDPLPGAPVNWSVVSGGGSIDQNGLFTAGQIAGDYAGTVVASSGGVTGSASVSVAAAPAPQILSLSPSVASAGDTLTATGQSFVSGAQVQIGTAPAGTVNVLSPQSLTFVVPALADGVYDVTVTNPDGQFVTLVNGLTVSSLNWITQTTLADFQAGAFDDTETLSGGTAGDGAVALVNSGFNDAFDGSALDPARWSSDLWQPDGSISVAGGQLTVIGAWARSTTSLTAGALAARLTFSSTAWQNVGLSRVDALANPWFLFGVPGWDTSQVYARFNFNGGAGDVPLGAGLLGSPHDYAIVVEPGTVRFLVDGQQVHQVAVPALPALAIWLSVGSSTGAGTLADSVGVLDYAASGEFLSASLDAGEHADWLRLQVDAATPAGTSMSFRARTSVNGSVWSAWSPSASSSPVDLALPAGRYAQYELSLATTSANLTPLANAVSGAYLPAAPPAAESVVVSPPSVTLAPGQTRQFSAEVIDENGQTMPGAAIVWSVANGGGTIGQNGLFTAGSTPGTFTDTVVATSDGASGSASVTVAQEPAPEITTIVPDSAGVGDTVTLNGANFDPAATLALDATPVAAINVVNASTITFSVPNLTPGDYDVTAANPDGQFATATGGLTILPASVPVQIVHTSASDFAPGALANAEITTLDGGEIRLTADLLDEFNGSQLDPDWSSGVYSGSGSVDVGGGQASVSGAWIQSGFSLGGTVITARLTFQPNGSPFLNFGFGAAGALDYPWFLFGIPGFDTGAVYARTNVPGAFYRDQRINGVSLNTPHDFTIRREPDRIVYEVDGNVVATHIVDSPSTTAPLALWFSSGNTGQTLIADWLRAEDYPTSGTYTSQTLDAGQATSWDSIAADLDLPAGTGVSASLRSSEDGSNWSAWSSASDLSGGSQPLAIPDGRFLEYRLTLTGDGTSSPEVRSISLEGQTL